jgi:hypothetical protein
MGAAIICDGGNAAWTSPTDATVAIFWTCGNACRTIGAVDAIAIGAPNTSAIATNVFFISPLPPDR